MMNKYKISTNSVGKSLRAHLATIHAKDSSVILLKKRRKTHAWKASTLYKRNPTNTKYSSKAQITHIGLPHQFHKSKR